MDGVIGEMRMFAGLWAPKSWAFCHGQLLAMAQNTALFSIIGTIYGGDGRTTFGLPDFRGRVVIGAGTGPGLTPYRAGQAGGQEYVTLNVLEMPAHVHAATFTSLDDATLEATNEKGEKRRPTEGAYLAADTSGGYTENPGSGSLVELGGLKAGGGTVTIGNAGASQSHENRQPFLATNYIICITGLYPRRN